MSRKTEHEFIRTDPEEIESLLVSGYEKITGITVRPGSPERLFIQWVCGIVIHERVLNNYTGNQNIPSRAEGENLDALAELFMEDKRPGAQSAVCTMRFYISEPQRSAILVPTGTRVTDTGSVLVWETEQDAYIKIGERFTDVRVRCQTAGTIGNGYALGQLNKLVDIYDYYSGCENISVSDGGSEPATDDEFYELLRASMDGYSCAGSIGGYIYYAKKVSTEIADVVPNSPMPGVAYIYVLMKDGKPAGEEIKKAVFEMCSASKVRAFTDDVHMGDPETVPYDIDFTYYIADNSTVSSADIQENVQKAVQKFVLWQSAKMGLDINPSKLHQLLMETGAKRVEMRAPVFTHLRDGRFVFWAQGTAEPADTAPQIAEVRNITIVNGGYEDE